MNDSAMWHKVNGVLVPTGDVNALPVQLYGSTIKSTVIMLERAVRTTNTFLADVTIPAGTKTMIVATRVYGVTGTFAAGQGLVLKSGILGIGPEINPVIYDTATSVLKTANSSISHFWGNGITKGEAIPYNATQFNHFCGFLGGTTVGGLIGITGTFEAGQGIDCSSSVYFLG